MKVQLINDEAKRTKINITEGYAIMHTKTSQWVHTYAPAYPENQNDEAFVQLWRDAPHLFNTKKEAFAARKVIVSDNCKRMKRYKQTTDLKNWERNELEYLKDSTDLSDFKVGKYTKSVTTTIEFK